MSDAPVYVILGRGRWARRMHLFIAGEGRVVRTIEEMRRQPAESDSAYISRLAQAMTASGAQIAWLCVLPGPHVSLMIQGALEAGLHVIAEKPWYGSAKDTERLQSLARAKRKLVAVHFEYLVHPEVENWKAHFDPGSGLRFAGNFFLTRPDHTGLPPMDNLGCHLLAIHEYAVPASELSEVQCAYERPDERAVWLERDGHRIASIDLLKGSERLIQEFMKKVEAARNDAAFPFDLNFALRVAKQTSLRKTCRSA